MVTVYGIKNCDTVKKACRKLDALGVDYHFHDYKKAGIDAATLQSWITELNNGDTAGWEVLVNRRGTTWRKLPDTVRDTLSADSAVTVMQENTSVIKRPVIEHEGSLIVGFNESLYDTTFG